MKRLPDHISGLIEYFLKPREKANEDLAIGYFRKTFDGFCRQQDAGNADGYVPGVFVLELKGAENDWLSGLLQGLAYARELDFSQVIVAAERFLCVWRLDELPEDLLQNVRDARGAPSSVGKKLARGFAPRRAELLKAAAWRLDPNLLDGLFANPATLVNSLKQFQETVNSGRRVRKKITPRNFVSVLKEMQPFFNPKQRLAPLRAFYSLIFGWNDGSKVVVSERVPDQATLNGELISNIVPGKREQLARLLESYSVQLSDSEHIDDFFARFDQALDAIDPDFRIQNGIFFTDLDLSKFVMWYVRHLLGDIGKNYLVIDPACGSGNLVTNWRSPLELRHKVVSEIEPELLFAVERRMKGDQWHQGRFTVVPKVSENAGLNFLDRSASEYLAILKRYLEEKAEKPDKPIAFLCNPPYRSDDDQTAESVSYKIHPSLIELTGQDASSERYCCFLAQMKRICATAEEHGLPGESLLLVFTKAAWLTKRPIFQKIRKEILGSFEDVGGVMINSREFFRLKTEFPIAFTIWRYVGDRAELDAERSVPLLDLTHLRRKDLSGLPWQDASALDLTCEKLLADPRCTAVPMGVERTGIRAWSSVKMTDFKRDRRQAEKGAAIVGGLPLGDPRAGNKKAYGDVMGPCTGFMDNVTPVRIKPTEMGKPWFRLNTGFMDCRMARCYSGPSDQKAYCAKDEELAKKLFFWFAISRTFAACGYPMWTDADELWRPEIPAGLESRVWKLSFAIGFAENECVATRFPANNPVPGAPENVVPNPMSPLDADSFWSRVLQPWFRRRDASAADRLVAATRNVFDTWSKVLGHKHDLPVSYERPYFIGPGELTLTAGLLQIRDYAREMEHETLLTAVREMDSCLKDAREELNQLLLDPQGLNYFGDPKKPRRLSVTQKVSFDEVLSRRVALASLIVSRLHEEKTLGRTKLAKLFFLADCESGLELKTDYRRAAAGPLDQRALYHERIGLEALALERRSFETWTKVIRTGKELVRYKPLEEIAQAERDARDVLGTRYDRVIEIIEKMRALDTDQCEIVATLYACWNDLLAAGETPSDDAILDDFVKWHHRKRRFARSRLEKALRWMHAHGIVPAGSRKRALADTSSSRPG